MNNKKIRVKIVDINHEFIPSNNGYKPIKYQFLAVDDKSTVYESTDTINCDKIYIGRYIIAEIDKTQRICNWLPTNIVEFKDIKQQATPKIASFVNEKNTSLIMRSAMQQLSEKYNSSVSNIIDYASDMILIPGDFNSLQRAYLFYVLNNYVEDEVGISQFFDISPTRLQLYNERLACLDNIDIDDDLLLQRAQAAPDALCDQLKPLTQLERAYIAMVVLSEIQCAEGDIGHFGMNGPVIQ